LAHLPHAPVEINRARQRLSRILLLDGRCGLASELQITDCSLKERMRSAKQSPGAGMQLQFYDGDVVASKDRMICRVEAASESLSSANYEKRTTRREAAAGLPYEPNGSHIERR